ncbi:hypothetical protein DPMN_138444 [Dreissena polymorpha]|uniref:Uncharacterized protein n=1 Tax=Dreissena polymorpha TaxID=45954 RepID=A0A9D4G7L8_DREPO|nr:hypothetical protein DPMN_138444 [Dreissena polymorpha]
MQTVEDTVCVDEGDSTGMSQATVSLVYAQGSDILTAKVSEFVKCPAGADAALAK